ncbi:hypothetical protein Rsub_05302 [Raphidocelis subcapitata]|uniref:Importin N-terminal domain-containing protein n=1 Tax=Raphidocelis subcapitata TaxID=307507 RepID=A0A2V0P2Z7_9CHLO|nr:hypothetical protein Rsub_05302 [Raphidocelis subcapitata]|eukprot:GBF92220.1 hypothetical protein Rsub_05302 [Raphidocelis subcapitata]
MKPDGQPADGPGGGAALAAQIDAALDAAFAAVEAALAQAGSPAGSVSAASSGAVAELLVRGLYSSDASVACRAAKAVTRFVRRDWAAAARAVAAAAGGAAVPALERLAASGDDAAADAAWTAVSSLLAGHAQEARRSLAQRYAAADGAVEGIIKAVLQRATAFGAIQLSYFLVASNVPEVSAQFAAADGFCAGLVSFVAAVCDSPWQHSNDCSKSCSAALACMASLLCIQPAAVVPALMAAEGLWAALEGVVARAGSSMDDWEVGAVNGANIVVRTLAEQNAAAARHAAGLDGLLVGIAAALAQPEHRQWAHEALRAVATHGGDGGDGEAAVAAAVAGALACAADDAARQQLRGWLAGPPMQMDARAIRALERKAVEAAALRGRVAELEAIPVNTRAAIVELAHAVRGKRRREEDEEAAAGEEQRR